MGIPINILIIEDSEDDAVLMLHEFRKSGYIVDYNQVMDQETLVESLQRKKWDLVLSDYSMPDFDGLLALETVRNFDGTLPFMLVSGTIDEDKMAQFLNAGANGCHLKSNLKQLVPTARIEMEEAKVKRCQEKGKKI